MDLLNTTLDPFRNQDNFLESIKFGSFESFASFDDVIKIDSDSEQLSEEDNQFVVIHEDDDNHVTQDFTANFQCEEEEDEDLMGGGGGVEVQQQQQQVIVTMATHLVTMTTNL